MISDEAYWVIEVGGCRFRVDIGRIIGAVSSQEYAKITDQTALNLQCNLAEIEKI